MVFIPDTSLDTAAREGILSRYGLISIRVLVLVCRSFLVVFSKRSGNMTD